MVPAVSVWGRGSGRGRGMAPCRLGFVHLLPLALGLLLLALPASAAHLDARKAVHAFYYLWYGTPETDGKFIHWDHEILPHWDAKVRDKYPHSQRFAPPDTIHAPFYPRWGPYSSRSRPTIRRHLEQLHEAGVGVLVLSWWGPAWRGGCHDTQGVVTDQVLPVILEEAEQYAGALKVAFHLEPYENRTALSVRQDLEYLIGKYGDSPALLRLQGKPVYYVYDSYHIPAQDWAALLQPNGSYTIRNSTLDGIFIALWLDQNDGEQQILPGGFDGFYTYFGCEGTSWASSPASWQALGNWAAQHGKLFVPSVAPGYNDSLIRPWNTQATRDREVGGRYDRYWAAALAAGADMISITSFNEWGEGTQIEPAIAMCSNNSAISYDGYYPGAPDLYLRITQGWTIQFQQVLTRRCAVSRPVCTLLADEDCMREEDDYV